MELPLSEIINDIFSGNKFDFAFMHGSWEKLRDRLHDSTMPPKESAYLHLFDLLYILEGPLSYVMNVVIYTLMRVGHHDIWSEKKQKFISSFEDVFEMPLATRLKFLNNHGFDFFSEICPRKVRNAVAHQNFKIMSDGSIHWNGNELALSKLKEINERMMDIVQLFVNML